MKLRGNQIAVILLRSPAYQGKIIIPESTKDTRMMSQIMYVLGRGPGEAKNRKTVKNMAQGTKRMRDVTIEIDRMDPNLYFVGHVQVGHWHFMKHPFVRDNGIWVSNLLKTHPEVHDMFDEDDTKLEGNVLQHRVFVTCASEAIIRVELEDGETQDSLLAVRRGDMMSAA